VALSVILLSGATLLIQSFHRLLAQDLGFRPEHILALTIGRPDSKGESLEARLRFFESLLTQTSAHLELRTAALVRGLPLREKQLISAHLHGTARPGPGDPLPTAGFAQVSPGYFHTMGIRLLQGRYFDETDRTNSRPVIIVDQTFVNNFHLGDQTLGKLIDLDGGEGSLEIVGVVNDIKRTGLADSPRGEIYRTFHQACPHQMSLLVRTERNATEIVRLVRSELDRIDKEQPIANVTTLFQLIETSVEQRRWVMSLMGAFSTLALFLAGMGLYGVLAYSVTQRTQEIGVRLALGANRKDIVQLVSRQGLCLAAVGIAVGLAGAFASVRILQNLLFQVKPSDPGTLGFVVGILLLVTLIASYMPARRATKVHLTVALKHS
jgi:putative ABC transport system permease protein